MCSRLNPKLLQSISTCLGSPQMARLKWNFPQPPFPQAEIQMKQLLGPGLITYCTIIASNRIWLGFIVHNAAWSVPWQRTHDFLRAIFISLEAIFRRFWFGPKSKWNMRSFGTSLYLLANISRTYIYCTAPMNVTGMGGFCLAIFGALAGFKNLECRFLFNK